MSCLTILGIERQAVEVDAHLHQHAQTIYSICLLPYSHWHLCPRFSRLQRILHFICWAITYIRTSPDHMCYRHSYHHLLYRITVSKIDYKTSSYIPYLFLRWLPFHCSNVVSWTHTFLFTLYHISILQLLCVNNLLNQFLVPWKQKCKRKTWLTDCIRREFAPKSNLTWEVQVL